MRKKCFRKEENGKLWLLEMRWWLEYCDEGVCLNTK